MTGSSLANSLSMLSLFALLALCGACDPQARDDLDRDDALPLAATDRPDAGTPDAAAASADAATSPVVPPKQTLRGVSGLYDAEIQAVGSGCPAGTTDVTLDDDGQTFSVRFSAFRLTIEPATTARSADCTFQLRLRSAAGLTFLFDVLSVEGRATLPEGVRARVAVRLQSAFPTSELQARLTGPVDGPFNVKADVRLADAAWSPCGLTRDLTLSTRVQLFNAERAVSGFVSLGAADDADALPAIRFRLLPRVCTPLTATPDAGR
jgi:hypothetical protein